MAQEEGDLSHVRAENSVLVEKVQSFEKRIAGATAVQVGTNLLRGQETICSAIVHMFRRTAHRQSN